MGADVVGEIEKTGSQVRGLSTGDRVIVGVNRHINPEEDPLEILRVSEEVEASQRSRLAALRRERDQDRVDAALDALRAGAEGDANLMELLVEAARARATLGEMIGAMKDVFGGYTEQPRV